MSRLETYLALIEAELDYAHFNALRTMAGKGSEGLSRAVREPFSCIFDSTRPDSAYYNRAVLLPSVEAAGETDFASLPDSVKGVEILAPQQTEETATRLTAAGFRPDSSLCYLVAEPEQEGPLEHRVERFGPHQSEEFFDLLGLSGADFSPAKRNLGRSYYCTEQFRCLVSYTENGQPTGWATSYLGSDGESVFFANAYTLPEFRRQGFHSALMQARLNEVIALGRKRAYTDVEPGSQSQQNAERLGFCVATKNVILHREKSP